MTTREENDQVDPAIVELGYEWHDVNVPVVALAALVCLVTLVVSVIALDGYFVRFREQLLREANDYDNPVLMELRAEEKGILTTYGVVDKEKGVYRVPIDQAMNIIAEEAFRSGGNSSRQ